MSFRLVNAAPSGSNRGSSSSDKRLSSSAVVLSSNLSRNYNI